MYVNTISIYHHVWTYSSCSYIPYVTISRYIPLTGDGWPNFTDAQFVCTSLQ